MRARVDLTGKLSFIKRLLFQKLEHTWVLEKRKPAATTRGHTKEDVDGLILSLASLIVAD